MSNLNIASHCFLSIYLYIYFLVFSMLVWSQNFYLQFYHFYMALWTQERGFLPLSAALLSSPLLRSETGRTMDIFVDIATKIEAMLLSLLFCRSGLLTCLFFIALLFFYPWRPYAILDHFVSQAQSSFCISMKLLLLLFLHFKVLKIQIWQHVCLLDILLS